jgi:hypothetical protein
MSLKGLECPVSKLVNSDTCPRRTPQDWPQIAEARERRAGSLRFGVDTVMEITPRSEADAAHFFADPHADVRPAAAKLITRTYYCTTGGAGYSTNPAASL